MSEIKNVTITVPVGLNGWQQTGSVVINGMKVEFPVGEETQVPETAAALLNELIAAAEKRAEDTAKPNNHYVGAVTIPAGKNLTLEEGAGIKRADKVILPETVLTYRGVEDDGTVHTLPGVTVGMFEIGKNYIVTYNGTAYELTAVDNDGLLILTPTDGSDAPYMVMVWPETENPDMSNVLACLSYEGATSVTLSIVEKGEAASVGGGKFIVHATDRTYSEVNPFEGVYTNAYTVTVDKELSEILAAFNNNMDVECREESEGNVTIYTLNNIGEGGCTFFSLLGAFVNMIVILPDGTAYFCTND